MKEFVCQIELRCVIRVDTFGRFVVFDVLLNRLVSASPVCKLMVIVVSGEVGQT